MTTGSHAICFGCAHLHRPEIPIDQTPAVDPPSTCDAFPTGIPDAIMYAGFDHRSEFPGDHGVRFLLDPIRAEELDAYEARVSAGG